MTVGQWSTPVRSTPPEPAESGGWAMEAASVRGEGRLGKWPGRPSWIQSDALPLASHMFRVTWAGHLQRGKPTAILWLVSRCDAVKSECESVQKLTWQPT